MPSTRSKTRKPTEVPVKILTPTKKQKSNLTVPNEVKQTPDQLTDAESTAFMKHEDDDIDTSIDDKEDLFTMEQSTTTFDASDQYFMAQSSKSKTTKNSFSALNEINLNEIQINDIIQDNYKCEHEQLGYIVYDEEMFLKCYHMMRAKFNILLYGYGSKRQVLSQFITNHLQSKHHYVILKGYSLEITIKHLIYILNKSINNMNDIVFDESCLFELLKQYYQNSELFLIIHSLDVLCSKNVKIQNFLLNLFMNVPQIRIISSVDHVNAPLMWSLTESSIFQWIWFPVNTYEPYRIERKFSTGHSMISSTSKSWQQAINFNSIQHVYESLNKNAQKIFLIILKQYCTTEKKSSILFTELYMTCREEFLVNSEITLKAQLSEFKDHNLLKIKKSIDGNETIILCIERLVAKKFVDSVENQ